MASCNSTESCWTRSSTQPPCHLPGSALHVRLGSPLWADPVADISLVDPAAVDRHGGLTIRAIRPKRLNIVVVRGANDLDRGPGGALDAVPLGEGLCLRQLGIVAPLFVHPHPQGYQLLKRALDIGTLGEARIL